MKREYVLFLAILVVVVAIVGTTAALSGVSPTSSCGFGCPPNVFESYQPCILGYSGFQVARQYPNPSTWIFTLREGFTGYLYYEYNVTEGLGYFIRDLNGPWTIWQTYQNSSSLLAEVSGSTVIHVQYNAPNQFPVIRPNESYTLGVQLSPEDYKVNGNLVNITWAVKGLLQGTYPVEAPDLEWHTVVVVAPSASINATTEAFVGTCGSGGTVDANG